MKKTSLAHNGGMIWRNSNRKAHLKISQIASFPCSDAKDRIWTFLVDFLEVSFRTVPKKTYEETEATSTFSPSLLQFARRKSIHFFLFFFAGPSPSATLQGPSTAMAGHGQLHPPGVDYRRCCAAAVVDGSRDVDIGHLRCPVWVRKSSSLWWVDTGWESNCDFDGWELTTFQSKHQLRTFSFTLGSRELDRGSLLIHPHGQSSRLAPSRRCLRAGRRTEKFKPRRPRDAVDVES